MWLVFAFVSVAFYAFCEIFQKKGSDLKEDFTELKILVWFGIASGLVSLVIRLFILKGSGVTAVGLVAANPVMILSPALYYASLFACFLAFKLIPVSIASPITCMDGVFTFAGVILMYLILGKTAVLNEAITPVKLLLAVMSLVGIYACGVIQSRIENREENKRLAKGKMLIKSGRFAVVGIILAVLSAVLDACSSLTDIYFLGEMSESYEYIYAHGILVLGFTLVVYAVLCISSHRLYNPFAKSEAPRMLGAVCDNLGMVFYMIAVAGNQIYTNVIVSCFCVFTVLLSRIILKEKIQRKQGISIAFTIACIVAFAIVDEMF